MYLKLLIYLVFPHLPHAILPTIAAMLSGAIWAPLALLAVGAVLLALWRVGDGAFQRAGQTIGTATGLDRIGTPWVFEPAHTAGNYLLREMIFVVGRKHAAKLRAIALGFAVALPLIVLIVLSTFIGAWITPPLAGVLPQSVGHAGRNPARQLAIDGKEGFPNGVDQQQYRKPGRHGWMALHQMLAVQAIGGDLHRIAGFAQTLAQVIRRLRFVFNHQDTHVDLHCRRIA